MSLLTQFSRELEELVARATPAVVGVEHRRGQGTGLLLAKDGYLLTNAHVVHGFDELRIRLSSGSRVKGELVGADERTDLAVLRIDADGLVSLPLADAQQLRVGQLVVAIGNPFRFERSVSLGVISALDRSLPGPRGGLFEGLIQTDAAINPGNSGGPLLDAEGNVLGINTAIIPWAQGIGFAIPSPTASWVAAVLIRTGEVRRPFLGIAARSEELTAAVGQSAGQARAVRILGVGANSPAQSAGLKKGDLLLSVNGKPTTSVDDLQRVMVLAGPGEVQLEIFRGERRQQLSAWPKPHAHAA
jgi:S1-C subfamily serine protease